MWQIKISLSNIKVAIFYFDVFKCYKLMENKENGNKCTEPKMLD